MRLFAWSRRFVSNLYGETPPFTLVYTALSIVYTAASIVYTAASIV